MPTQGLHTPGLCRCPGVRCRRCRPTGPSSRQWTPAGRGDAYAAGVLHGLLSGLDPAAVGTCGSRCASAVISRTGACLTEEEAAALTQDFPTADSTPWNLRSLLAQPQAAAGSTQPAQRTAVPGA